MVGFEKKNTKKTKSFRRKVKRFFSLKFSDHSFKLCLGEIKTALERAIQIKHRQSAGWNLARRRGRRASFETTLGVHLRWTGWNVSQPRQTRYVPKQANAARVGSQAMCVVYVPRGIPNVREQTCPSTDPQQQGDGLSNTPTGSQSLHARPHLFRAKVPPRQLRNKRWRFGNLLCHRIFSRARLDSASLAESSLALEKMHNFTEQIP